MPVAQGLYYYEYLDRSASGPPVVLIHGAGGTHLFWPPGIRRLPGQHVFALDLPGHGKSDHKEGFQTIQDYTRAVRTWLDAASVPRAVFVGHSMGGAIALSLTVDFPAIVAGLGLVSTGARLKVNPELLNYTASSTTVNKAVELLASWLYSPSAPFRLVELAARRLSEARPGVLHGDLLACDGFDLRQALGQIRKPALVICGAEDRMTPLRLAQHLAGSIHGAHLKVIPRAGHMVMLEQPRAVQEALAEFLSNYPYL